MKLYNLSLLLEAVMKFVATILMLGVMAVFVAVMIGLFILMIAGMGLAWAFGMPIKVTTPGLIPGTKITRYYRWFKEVRN